ncbi:hemerythrin domain-containing protein [Gordonia aurantiaca]|uniref:hemerythrin domain-containing protein n=1 Tax=Gordonia sp. B21 TaxID=3151852 RepID=UPI003266C976
MKSPFLTLEKPTRLRLPGQAAAPEGPVDPFMMYVAHHMFRRDLTDFAAAVPVTPLDDTGTWRALATRWELFSDALHHHHNGEDLHLWPLLEERADESEKIVLEAMESEHDLIDPLLEESAAGFAAMVERPGGETRATLADVLSRARTVLGDHLAHEETDALAIVQRRMTPRDWEDFEAMMNKTGSIREMMKVGPLMLKGLSDQHLSAVYTRVPAALKLIVRLGGPSFRRLDGRAFYYVAH